MYESGNNRIAITAFLYLICINPKAINELAASDHTSTRNSSIEDSEYTPRVKSLLGCITLPEDFDYKKEVADYLTKKYL
jgi:hypothetical protein